MRSTVLRSLGWLTTSLALLATALAANTYSNSTAAGEATPVAPPPRTVAVSEMDNPRVEPGKVKWHSSFADAKAASEKSGKPVLLFHLMGQLDRQFC